MIKSDKHIFIQKNNQWLESTILIPDESYVQSSFGTMVGTTDNYSIIGAPGYNITIGRAIIYKNKDNNWEEDIVLNNPNQSQLNFYGSSLSITDDWAVVGGYNNLQSNNQSMFISVYQNVNGEWTFFQNIDIPLLHNIYSVRSYNLSIENNKLLVGGFLPYNNNKDIGVGGIFVYELNDNEWTLQQDIKPDGYEDYEIGKGVSLSKNFAFIGTQKQSTTNPDSIQSILIYEREDDDSWNQILNYQLPNDSSSFSIHSGNNFGIIASSKEIDKEGIVFVFDLRTLSTTSLTLKDPSISMFPNPCHDFLQIRGSNKIESVNVYDITGQLFLVKKKTNITELNVKSWPKGIYTIQMKSKDHYISKKVIKN